MIKMKTTSKSLDEYPQRFYINDKTCIVHAKPTSPFSDEMRKAAKRICDSKGRIKMIHNANVEILMSDIDYIAYDDIVNDFGADVIDTARLGDYSGDILYLLRSGDQIGLLEVGYGSCSGCDALESALPSVTEVQNLADSLFDSIIWKSDAKEMIEYLKSLDPACHFWCGGYNAKQAMRSFIDTLKNLS
jgi:hypothetical protein